MFRVAMLASFVAFLTLLHLQRSFTRVRSGFAEGVNRRLVAASLRTWIVGGMMGSGKTTFAKSLAQGIGVPHIEIDTHTADGQLIEEIMRSEDGWIAEANPWQIPAGLVKGANVIVFLDYDNVVNYVRLLLRGYQEWALQGFTWEGFKGSIIERTFLDLGRIVFRYGKANRNGWKKKGLLEGIDLASTTYIDCISPAELRILHDLAIRQTRGQQR